MWISDGSQLKGDDDEDDVDGLRNEVKYGPGNNSKTGWQWDEDADLSSSSGHDSQLQNPHLTNGQLVIFYYFVLNLRYLLLYVKDGKYFMK